MLHIVKMRSKNIQQARLLRWNIRKTIYGLENFVVVADSGLMNNANIVELEANGYKYIIGAKIKNESQEVKNWILEQPKQDCHMVEYDKGGGRRLLVG